MIIAERFNGPPGSGNGGYSAGVFAASAPWSGVAEVTLRKPPPLETELVATIEAQTVQVKNGAGELVAEARPATVGPDELVEAVSRAEAVEAARNYLGHITHPFPTCFVCGPARPAGDGLHIYPGRLSDGRTAAPFTAPAELPPEIIWAALDCPGGWSVAQETRPYVLGRMAARIDALPAAGDECVVMGQLLGEDGRKALTLTSLYGPDGALLATARSTWVSL